MPKVANKPILVTGTQRSGTTWVGKMLATHPKVVYFWEPFNVSVPNTPVEHWYHHVTAADQEQFHAFLQPYLTLRNPWWADIKERMRPRRIAGATYRTALAWWRRNTGCRTLMKDPTALFAAEWLAGTFGMDVVVMIRHPAAFASSMKRLNWHANFAHLWRQPELMQSYLQPFHDEVRRCAEQPTTIIDQAILLWRVIHHVILRFQRAHPDWIFLRHEDLSRRPIEEFQKLFSRLDLTVTQQILQTIETHSCEENPREAPERIAHQLRRDSKANIWNWRRRLLPEEIAHIRRETHDVARFFYTDADWDGEFDSVRRSA